MAWPQVPQAQIHLMLPDPIAADTGMMLGLLHQEESGLWFDPGLDSCVCCAITPAATNAAW